MEYELVPVNFNKVMQSKSYTVFILSCESMQFAIYTDPHVGQNIQIYITEKKYPRPLTHDMMHFIFDGFNIELLQIVITDVQDTVYYARLYLQQRINDNYKILEIDTRPSDCLPLALIKNIPIYCRRNVLTKIIPLRD